MADYSNPDSLVSTQWVADHGSDANVRLVEVDVDTAAYEQGHVAGAVGWNWQSPVAAVGSPRHSQQSRNGAIAG